MYSASIGLQGAGTAGSGDYRFPETMTANAPVSAIQAAGRHQRQIRDSATPTVRAARIGSDFKPLC